MKKIVLIVLVVLTLIFVIGCSSEKSTKTPEPATKSGEDIKNTDIIKPNENMGITINKVYFKTIETNTQVTERGYLVEPQADGYNITICSGEKPSAGYGITVKMIEDNEGKTNILVEETEPIAGQSYASVITYPATTISIGNNISPDFHVSNSKGDIFPQLSPMISASPTIAKEENQFEITKSDKIPGWQKLKASVILQGLTEGGSTPLEKPKRVTYSIHFPGTWNFNSTVIYDENNKKIAELPPAVLLKPGQESVFLENKPDMNLVDKLISHQGIKINSYPGSKTIIQVMTQAGSWFPHIYRLSDGTHGFSINLYLKEINKEEQELFDSIVNTFEIN